MVRARSNKCQSHERERINSSSSPNNRFVVKKLESTQRERQKIRGINQELSEDDKGLKRANGSGSRRWEYNSVVRGKLDSTPDSHPDTEGVKSTVEKKESLLDEVAEEETELELVLGELGLSRKKIAESRSKKVVNRSKKIAKAQSTRSMMNADEGKRQTSGEEVRAKTLGSGSSAQPNLTTSKIAQKFLKRQIRKALPASGTTISDKVAQGKRRVEPLGGSGKKVAEGRSASVDDLKEVDERARLAILQGKEDTSQMESELKKAKSELEKILARAKADALKRVKQLKAAHAVATSQLQVEAKANLDEMAEERDRLGLHLMMKGYSQEEVDAIKANTYTEEEEDEAEVLGVVDGLDGVFPQTVLDIQGDDAELPKGGSEKVVREMSFRINDLESGLAREKETSKSLLSAQAELQVELNASRVREDHALMCNREFAEQFDRMKEASENKEDQCVKAHFRLKKLNQIVSDLTRQVEEKDSGIKKGLEDLSAATEPAENLQRQVDVFAVKGKQTDIAQYRIQALE
ncbi:hypothetical protein GIB67_000255 [Kingdonia uniflora]|uniref:Uncharacterized protein n=1 Tax=Kingdonia uniflora TaxID=39325 RepID=A0A7J7LC35_9MAGN|nr:hypothetical protein GIB67_000255 [Kingdonia uniflora]